MVFCRAKHYEQFGALQIRPAEFPKRAANGVNHPGRHVHRAKAAVRSVVGRTELPREQASKRLHLIASGEQREFFGVGRPQVCKPLFHHTKGFVPANRLELGVTALGARLSPQRLRQPRGGVLLHDARCTLGTNHALIQRVIGIAFDITHFTIA